MKDETKQEAIIDNNIRVLAQLAQIERMQDYNPIWHKYKDAFVWYRDMTAERIFRQILKLKEMQ